MSFTRISIVFYLFLFFYYITLDNSIQFKSYVDQIYTRTAYVARVSGIFTMEYPLILVLYLNKYKYVFYNLHHMQIPMYYARGYSLNL